MSNNLFYIRDSVWESVYHPLWKTVRCGLRYHADPLRLLTFKPFENSFRNSIINPVCDVCFETIEKINNE